MLVDALVGVPAVTGLVLAVIIRERHRARDAVERLVEERTRWLRSDRERLVAVQRLAKLGSLAWNVAGQTVDWSPEVLALHGRPETPVPPTWEDYGELVVPADRQGLRMLAATAWQLHEPFTLEYRVTDSDGNLRDISACGAVESDATGRAERLRLTCQDVTARRIQQQAEQDLRQSEAALAHAALHDSLTGLPNRVLLADRLEQALRRSTRTGNPVAVLFVDLDRFKLINDSLGHAAGDQVIEVAAERLLETVRSGDTVARFGGDEFVVIADEHDRFPSAAGLAERMNAVLREPFTVEDREVFLAASIGIAVGRGGEATADGLVRDADAAMYRAKESGRGRIEFFDEPMRSEAAQRLETQNALHHAVDRGELRLYYQPIVELRSSRVVGVEALLRWQHPERGLLGPADFISVAEEAGLIVPIGRWVIEEAARACGRWQHQGLFVSVNLSARQLRQPDLCDVVESALQAEHLAPGVLRLELTESVLMEDLEFHGRTLNALRDLGTSLAIDDFGTGYSSLTYLRRFPVTMLKIDRSFVAGLAGISPIPPSSTA